MTNLLLWLHVGFAIFALGPLTAVTMAAPRAIRNKDVAVLRFLQRSTRIYGLGALGVLVFGLWLGGPKLGAPYLTISMTLFVVALVLLFIVERDLRSAVRALSSEGTEDDAKVQNGRIAALSGVVALIWLVILFLMFAFNPGP
ncbi:hypothetical protein HNP84_003821 [Thermocatellispora tengchongensis]|uniref:DUF2269 family protein n=1 Tax=Thermocatellispora tengchongensis TaxID=1073253 RepID=A0A840PDH8_9ACTN|nr:DUF2269 family protein [Thermocatellispora tengchongensis]MBB5134095.1 hypothetical protein [Thermocatellispora tengchongensis]